MLNLPLSTFYAHYVLLPVMTPVKIVPKNGVLNLGCTFPKLLNIKPSLDIAYRILGNGNMAPNMLKTFIHNNYPRMILN